MQPTTISPWLPEEPFQHGAAIAFHDGKLHVSYAVNRKGENLYGEECHFRTSVPGGAVSYPYAIEHDGCLYMVYSDTEGRERDPELRETWNNNAIKLVKVRL